MYRTTKAGMYARRGVWESNSEALIRPSNSSCMLVCGDFIYTLEIIARMLREVVNRVKLGDHQTRRRSRGEIERWSLFANFPRFHVFFLLSFPLSSFTPSLVCSFSLTRSFSLFHVFVLGPRVRTLWRRFDQTRTTCINQSLTLYKLTGWYASLDLRKPYTDTSSTTKLTTPCALLFCCRRKFTINHKRFGG